MKLAFTERNIISDIMAFIIAWIISDTFGFTLLSLDNAMALNFITVFALGTIRFFVFNLVGPWRHWNIYSFMRDIGRMAIIIIIASWLLPIALPTAMPIILLGISSIIVTMIMRWL